MTPQEFHAHLRFMRARNKHRSFQTRKAQSKRSVKAVEQGRGQVLKRSHIVPQINMEWHYPSTQRL